MKYLPLVLLLVACAAPPVRQKDAQAICADRADAVKRACREAGTRCHSEAEAVYWACRGQS